MRLKISSGFRTTVPSGPSRFSEARWVGWFRSGIGLRLRCPRSRSECHMLPDVERRLGARCTSRPKDVPLRTPASRRSQGPHRVGCSRPADSGWSLTVPREKVGSQFLRISLYQLGVDRPDLIKFFALSPGLQVHLDNLQICVTGPDGEIQPAPGSYLERLKKHRIQRFAE